MGEEEGSMTQEELKEVERYFYETGKLSSDVVAD